MKGSRHGLSLESSLLLKGNIGCLIWTCSCFRQQLCHLAYAALVVVLQLHGPLCYKQSLQPTYNLMAVHMLLHQLRKLSVTYAEPFELYHAALVSISQQDSVPLQDALDDGLCAGHMLGTTVLWHLFDAGCHALSKACSTEQPLLVGQLHHAPKQSLREPLWPRHRHVFRIIEGSQCINIRLSRRQTYVQLAAVSYTSAVDLVGNKEVMLTCCVAVLQATASDASWNASRKASPSVVTSYPLYCPSWVLITWSCTCMARSITSRACAGQNWVQVKIACRSHLGDSHIGNSKEEGRRNTQRDRQTDK